MTDWEKEFDSRFNNIWTDSWNAKLGCPDIKPINMRLKQFIRDLLKEEREKVLEEMSWRKMAYHKCGYLIEDIPHNNIGFLTDFVKYCPKCGKRYKFKDLDIFVGKKVWNGKWYNPFSWKFKIKKLQLEVENKETKAGGGKNDYS